MIVVQLAALQDRIDQREPCLRAVPRRYRYGLVEFDHRRLGNLHQEIIVTDYPASIRHDDLACSVQPDRASRFGDWGIVAMQSAVDRRARARCLS